MICNRFLFPLLTAVSMLGLLTYASQSRANALEQYVHQEATAFDYEVVETFNLGQVTGYQVRMTSQVWRDKPWKHWLTVLVPERIRHADRGILVIAGGNNTDQPPGTDVPEADLIGGMAASVGAPVAVVQQVPNQPLFDGLREDALIAKTFDRFLEQGDQDWPLLLPMTKSAVRAMDAMNAVVHEHHDQPLEQFIVGGGSKRGWTSYLTAAVDERVIGLVPIVIDMLDFKPQILQQLRSYGQTSDMIRDYRERNVIQRLLDSQAEELMEIVDPFQHRDSMQMPKLVMLGTNDPYWTVDAANIYFTDLPPSRYLHYGMNVGHDVAMDSIPTLLSFFEYVLTDKALPELTWQRHDDGSLTVSWDTDALNVQLVQATADTRDFREASWSRTSLETDGREVNVQVPAPEDGYVGYYVDVSFPADAAHTPSLRLSTEITVLPDTFPYEANTSP